MKPIAMAESDVIARLGFAVPNYFGGCPECGQLHRILNIYHDHWAMCRDHKNKWHLGSNLLSGWRHEDESVWRENWNLLSSDLEIEPLPSTNPDDYADREYYRKAWLRQFREIEERRWRARR